MLHDFMLTAIFLTLPAQLINISVPAGMPNVSTIVQKSVEANEVDWNAEPDYNYVEQDDIEGVSKTWQVLMIDGSPYRRLVKVNGKPLSRQHNQNEEKKLQNAIEERRAESPEQRAQRLANYEKGRKRDHSMLDELSKAFDFMLVGEKTIGGRRLFILRAAPRRGYRAPNRDAQVLTGMQGELWIDAGTYQWVRATARVVHPVSIDGFLAQVEPGTFFELEKMPVADGIWLPKHFVMRANSRILGLFGHHDSDNETFFDYRKANSGRQSSF